VNILVTGAAGFIGSHLAEKLARLGHHVVGLDCFTDYYDIALKRLNAEQVAASGVEMLESDLAEDPLGSALDGMEALYHCAAQPGISDTVPFEAYLRNNIVATHRLIDAALQTPGLACFVNVSTSSVYGAHATDSEEAAPKPASFYGVTKLAAEQLVLAGHREKELPACSLRLFSVYGPRERPEKLYPRLIAGILADGECPLYEGSLQHSRSFTYIDDAVGGLIAVLDHLDSCVGEIFNIGSDIEITTAKGIEIVQKLLGAEARFAHLPKRKGDQLHTHADISKARRILDYNPTTRPEDGLRAEVEWFKDKVFGNAGQTGDESGSH